MSRLPITAALATLCFLALAFAGCSKPAESGGRSFRVKGMIRGMETEKGSVTIEHEEIPDVMPAMTMPFEVRESGALAHLQINDAVSFELVMTDDDAWIRSIERISPWEVSLPETPPASAGSTGAKRLREGDPFPDFDLVRETGEPVTLASLRGRPFVLTFIFTRCPMPNFCPLMSQNFQQLQELVKGDPKAETRLLSVTIDPVFDTPAVLRNYGKIFHQDPRIWTFVSGEPSRIDALARCFSVYVKPEGGSITHGLATILVDAKGVVRQIWRGNSWEPSQVFEALERVWAQRD